jgi:hypothetical protein
MTGPHIMKCSICHGPIDIQQPSGWARGHNAEPVKPGRCCTDCNVVNGRSQDRRPTKTSHG